MAELTAFALEITCPPVIPASAIREWMDTSPEKFAYRCLPLKMANQVGWWILNTASFEVSWDGGEDITSIHFKNDEKPSSVASHFGHGILTFCIPYLFRTSTEYNLIAKGPANYPKHGIYALDGLIETDWAVSTFTMNWIFTSKNEWVSFCKDEPICMIVPLKRGELESFQCTIVPIDSNPSLKAAHEGWALSREINLVENKLFNDNSSEKWEKHYLHGNYPGVPKIKDTQKSIKLQEFKDLRFLES